MKSLGIFHSSGLITNNVIHIDLEQYNSTEVCSAFLVTTPESNVILDCGTSNDVPTLLTHITTNLRISLKKIKYLIPTHYHFDHFGGGWFLWKQIKEYNPEVKILTTLKTKEQLQEPTLHMKRAGRTFGNMIGEMQGIPEEAFEIIFPDEEILLPGFNETQSLSLVPSPGHCDDHVCPTLFNNYETEFMFLGEAAGTRMNPKNLLTLGTSMPPEFNFTTYVQSLERLIKFNPKNIGLGHFGVIKGQEFALQLMKENLEFTHHFRTFVKDKYEEKNETKWIVDQFIEHELEGRVDPSQIDMRFLTRIIVALVYGQLIDLGFRKPK